MGWIRRAISVVFALLTAIGTGLIFLPVAVLADPEFRSASFAFVQFALAGELLDRGGWDEFDDERFAALIHFIWTALMAVCAIPVVCVALLGEIAKVRAMAWYAGATGVTAALTPWFIRAALRLPRASAYNFAEMRLAFVFLLAGLLSGSVYWILAGRSAGRGAER